MTRAWSNIRIAIHAAVAMTIAGLLALLVFRLVHQEPPPRVGAVAPSFTLQVINGKREIRLSAFRGRPVVLNFWASWCPPCKEEAPLLEKTWLRFGPQGVEFLGVDFHDVTSDAMRFIAAHALTFPILQDGSGNVTTGLYGVTQAPETFVISRTGHVVLHIAGPIDQLILRTKLEPALRRAGPS